MNVRLTPRERSLGLLWVAATVVGWVLGFLICEVVTGFLTTLFVDGLIIGASIGIAQWVVLRQRLPQVRWWAILSILGFGIGRAAGEIAGQGLTTAIGNPLTGALIGVSVGIAQWLALRRHFVGAGWWVLASFVAWALGWTIIVSTENAVGSPNISQYLGGAIGAALAGIITGAALIWVSRRAQEPRAT